MQQPSRYSDERIEKLLADLVCVLENHRAPTDLSLMVLGNMVTNIINTSISPAQRRTLAFAFTEALVASVREIPSQT